MQPKVPPAPPMRLNPQNSGRQRSQSVPPTPERHSQWPLLQPAVAMVAPVGPGRNSGGAEVSQLSAETNRPDQQSVSCISFNIVT